MMTDAYQQKNKPEVVSQNPRVSVIIAVLNERSAIKETIDSVVSQDYRNLECIVVDGGSTDGTVEEIQALKNQTTIVISEPDTGIYDAWNKGIKQSTGEWLTFLGAGDTYLPEALTSYMQFIQAVGGPTPLLVSSRVQLVNRQGHVFRTVGAAWGQKQSNEFMNVAHTGALHHRHLFKRYGLFDTSYKIAGDYELLLRAGSDIKTAFLDKVTLKMPIGGISNRSTTVFDEWYRAKRMSGKRSWILCVIEKWIALFKFYVRNVFLERGYRRQ